MILERYIEWCDNHEKLVIAVNVIAVLVLGPLFYCSAQHGGRIFDLIRVPLDYISSAMSWICGC